MGRLTFSQFISDQWRALPEVETFKADLSGRTIIVTGANIGLGYECSLHLARMNPGQLILACRDEKKGWAAVESIVKETNCPNIECWLLDNANLESVKAFGDRYEKEGGGTLDLLIENAGISNWTYVKTVDGFERALQVNHIATAHLAFRLLPFLLKAPDREPTPRLVIVSSEAHYLATEDAREAAKAANMLEKLSDEEYCKSGMVMLRRYPLTKLFNVLFTRTLAGRIPTGSLLTLTTVNPGTTHSALQRDSQVWWMRLLYALVGRTTEMGSRTLVHAAVAADAQNMLGEYLNACKKMSPSDLVMSEEGWQIGERLWDETVQAIARVDPKVPEIIGHYLVPP